MLRTATTTPPKITNIEDTKSLMSYSHYLITKAQFLGNNDIEGQKSGDDELHITEKCRSLSEKLTHKLNACTISDIPELLECYDMTFRIGNGRIPDSKFIKRYKQRVIEAWNARNSEIAESSIYGMLLPDVVYQPQNADKQYASILRTLKKQWIATLKKFGRFPAAKTAENYRRLAYIMRENLDRELDGHADSIKLQWYALNKIEDLKTVSSDILVAYRRFVSSLFPTVLDYDTQLALDTQILAELTGRPDLPPHTREAHRLALHLNHLLRQS